MSEKQIALQRIKVLFNLAREVINTDPKLAQRYFEIARRIAMRTRIHLPQDFRRMICKHCKKFILPGINCRVRIQQKREPHVVITCLSCGGYMRIPLKSRKNINENKKLNTKLHTLMNSSKYMKK